MTKRHDEAAPKPAEGDDHGDESLLPDADPEVTSGAKWSRDEGDRVKHADGT